MRAVHALDEFAYVSGEEDGSDLMRIARGHSTQVLQEAMDVAKSSGVPADSKRVEVPGRRLGDLVADEATSWEADLVVVGTHGRRGVGRVLLGSGAEQVIRQAPVPVLSIRSDPAA